MRGIVLALGLILSTVASALWALDIEEERSFPALDGSGDSELAILSTTDTVVFAPVIVAFQTRNPSVTVRYTVASTTSVFGAIHNEGAAFDVVVSSAMDLQMKLANDGLAQGYRSDRTLALPEWARWRDRLFGFAQEPVVTVLNRAAFAGVPLPRTRADLIRLMRDRPDMLRGRIGTYDPNVSGAGYLFATQDARQSDTYWRLSEVMGGLSPRLYATSSAMLSDLKEGRIVLAYNVLGSYAATRPDPDESLLIVEPEDFTHILLRTALIARASEQPELAAAFVDFLLSPEGQAVVDTETGLPAISAQHLRAGPHLRPIRLDPGLLVFVDPLMRQRFLSEWSSAVLQR